MVRNQKINSAERQQEQGVYSCTCCGEALFEASKKFDVGSGFPSFWAQIGANVQHKPLDTYGRERIQLLCHQCGQHLGHLFDDARTPSLVRYCINREAVALEKEREEK
ncbi:peptide-methionine (R)-S-oxide reductase [Pontibacter actiniarum]|uniref:peptide-methionine (R)-S-oxide reductase n=1 Tax=Pontibacter actiniarum TaxID=323450 RepID=A0A1X9YW06_9BACT|nr:peptide-methionine (R)-S-oxide reductase [Pontibacter actiniarum]ARS37022.1 methionine-R-sulfoxide reductase [Pontibacter actiniarum]